MVYTTEKMLKENGDKVKEDDKKIINEKVEALKKLKDGTDIDAIKKATEELSSVVQKVGAAMYNATQGAPGTPGADASGATAGNAGEPKKDEPMEGEIVDDKDKK